MGIAYGGCLSVVSSSPIKGYPHCLVLVLVGSRNGFEREFHNRTKINE